MIDRAQWPPIFVNVPEAINPPPGYWEFIVTCTDPADPGTIRYFVPGAMLPHLRDYFPEIDLDDARYARVLAEYHAEQQGRA
jgi:hypothetical protein